MKWSKLVESCSLPQGVPARHDVNMTDSLSKLWDGWGGPGHLSRPLFGAESATQYCNEVVGLVRLWR